MTPAIDILRSDRTLLTAFLLRHTPMRGAAAFNDPELVERFLLWFAVEGRIDHAEAVLSPAYLAFLAEPAPPYATRLAAHLLKMRPELHRRFGHNADLFHAWYYGGGAAAQGLLPLLSVAERRFLADTHPLFGSMEPALSRAAYFGYLRDSEARTRYDLNSADDRLAAIAAFEPAGDPLELAQPVVAPVDRGGLPGCNVIGFAEGVLGIGEDARALTSALGHAGVNRCICNIALPDRHATNAASGREALYVAKPLFPVNIFAMTAFETARLVAREGRAMTGGRYNIGYWPWELTNLPEDWRFVFDLVDEIWAPSRFLVDVYRRLTDKPVVLMPPLVEVPEVQPMDLAQFGIERGATVFLTMFDFNSFVARKNPQASITAFKMAFPDRSGPERMIVKSLNAHGQPERLADIQRQIGDDDRFILMDGAFSRAETCSLIAAADCFVSLHRAEGFGRVMAEAMLLRTAVVATGWSGNTDFLSPETGLVVDASLRNVEAGEYVFWEGSEWAEPSLEAAARAMREMAARPSGFDAMLDRARRGVAESYSAELVAQHLADRLSSTKQLRPAPRSGA